MEKVNLKMGFILIISALLSFFFAGCSETKISNPDGMTPVETVQRYFYYWQEKNIDGMNSLVYYTMRSINSKQISKSIKLNSCVEETEDIEYNDDWYKNPNKYTCVDASFEEIYQRDGDENFTDTANWQFYLVKEFNNTNWFIVMIAGS